MGFYTTNLSNFVGKWNKCTDNYPHSDEIRLYLHGEKLKLFKVFDRCCYNYDVPVTIGKWTTGN